MAKLQTEAVLCADHVGDVVGVQFSQEEELAIFIPSSGDVLLCTASQWRSLKNMPVLSLPGSLSAPVQSASMDEAVPVADLKSTLLGLGACLA